MRMIDGDDLIIKIKEHCNPYGNPDYDYATSIKIIHLIENLALDSPVPRFGHWYDDRNFMKERTGWSRCSYCNRASAHETVFCPHCGARMDVGNE